MLAAATATCQTVPCQRHCEKDKGGLIRLFEDPPGVREGSTGRMYLAYLRDPAGNSVEIGTPRIWEIDEAEVLG